MSARPSTLEIPCRLAQPYKDARRALLERFEREYVEALIADADGNISAASRAAGITRRHLRELLRKYGLRES